MFEPSDYSAVRKPLLEASTLPAHCYTSRDFFALERTRIFSRAWHFAGRLDELPTPGDYLVIDTVAGAALIVRDASNNLHGFLNACRHRGTRLKNSSGRCGGFICPYHGWSYSLNGELRAAPGMDATGFSRNDYPLQAIRTEVWGGFIFVNFDSSAPPLLSWLGNLPVTMQSHAPENLVCTRRFEFTIQANWKFVIENAVEAYHTGTVHKSTLGAQRSESIRAEGHWDALFVLNDAEKGIATLPNEIQALPFIDTMGSKAKQGTWFTVIYPCTQLVFSQDCVWWLDIKPVTVNETRLIVGGCFPRSTVALEHFTSSAAAYYHRWHTATAEDNAIAESQQKGHLAGLQVAGRFASTEHCVHALDNWVLDQIFGEATT